MSRYKEPKQELINQLLFSSHGDDSHNLSQENSNTYPIQVTTRLTMQNNSSFIR